MKLGPDTPWISRNGWLLLAIVAAGAAGLYVLSHWRTDCQRFEEREVKMLHNGRFGQGLRTHRYKVCVDETQPSGEN